MIEVHLPYKENASHEIITFDGTAVEYFGPVTSKRYRTHLAHLDDPVIAEKKDRRWFKLTNRWGPITWHEIKDDKIMPQIEEFINAVNEAKASL